MAESKGALIAKSVQKHAGRAKEKILQNLGKVDRTADEIFDEHLSNFTKQQISANRLQKEFNNYIRCIRALQAASKTLMDTIAEIYEPQWVGADALRVQASSVEVLFQDYAHKLGEQILVPLNTYTAQFPEMRKKIEKRGRKLVDYDSQRHSFQNLQSSAAKRKDDLKVNKSKEQLDEAKRTYELLNTELHDELPALYDSRVLFLVSNLQTLFASEQVFHNETSRIYAELEAIVDKLATDSQKGSYTFKKITSDTANTTPTLPSPASLESNGSNGKANVYNNGYADVIEIDDTNNRASSPTAGNGILAAEYQNSEQVLNDSSNANANETKPNENESDFNKNVDDQKSNDTAATTVPKPKDGATGLYKVKATYKYTKEDGDELSFEVGDIIQVIEYEDPEDQEEGWLMGVKETTGERGLFPANFTKPL